jgi:hypothetical protein
MLPGKQFEGIEASLLLCPRCRVAQPVRKRLLLCLPEGDKYEFVCVRCGSTCGDKMEEPPGKQTTAVPGRPTRLVL